MKKILVFGASNSSNSINHKLAMYAGSFIDNAEIIEVDMNDFEMPIYGIDKEKANGIPNKAVEFKEMVKNANGLIISFAEHNGTYTVAFKNVMDWISRLKGDLWENKPMLLLATSPGKRGARKVLKHAAEDLPYRGAQIIAHFSLPSFGDNFTNGKVVNEELNNELKNHINNFKSQI